jgi:hypothetical protein
MYRVGAVVVVVVLGVSVACGHVAGRQSPDAADTPVDASDASIDAGPPGEASLSGSRIKITWLTTADGFKFQPGSYDSQLKLGCSWVDTADGKRCLPPMSSVSAYLDPSCTRPVVTVASNSCAPTPTPPSYVGNSTPTTCGSQVVTVNAVGNRLSATQIFTLTSSGCVASDVPAGTSVYAVDEPVPLSAFVKAVPGVEAVSGRFAHSYLLAEDGARLVTGILDTQLKIPCVLQGPTGLVKCVPNGPVQPNLFSDADCQSVLVGKPVGSCAVADAPFALYDAKTCGARVFQRGADFPGTGVFTLTSASCIATTVTAGSMQHVGAEIATPTLAYSQSSTRLGVGEARLDDFTSTYASAASSISLHDNKLDFDCLPFMHGADGVRRCLPPPFPDFQVVYTDAMCTVPINVVFVGPAVSPTTCALTPPRFVVHREGMNCITPPFLAHLFPVTTPITAPLFSMGASCQPLSNTGPVYAVGPEEPPTSFEEIKTTTDP